jgi:hypothetical protein
MSKKTNSDQVTASEPSRQSIPAVTQEESVNDEKGLSGKSHKKKLAVVIILLAVVVLAIVVLYNYKSQKKQPSNIVIGSTTITPQEISEFSKEVARYSKVNDVKFGHPAKQVAEDDLILNAALKDQAAEHHVTVNQNDIDSQFSKRYASYGSKDAYDNFVKKAGFANLVRVVAENNVYEAKLYSKVIATKNVFVVFIGIDTPYVDSSKNPAALRAQATKTLQTKFLPMFKRGWSNTKIASYTDVNLLSSKRPANNIEQYYTSMPVIADTFNNCTTAKPCFNDQPSYKLLGIVTAQSKLDSLMKVGQYTGVFTSKAGFIGIMRLTSKSSGSYNSWDQLLQDYKDRYKSQLSTLAFGGSPAAIAGGFYVITQNTNKAVGWV